jgi:hypothetical protein
VLTGGELVTRMAWARFCGTCGMALLLCGLIVLAITGIMMLIAPEDGLGSLIVLAAFGVCAVLMLLWTGLYLRQFGTIGVIRPKPPKPEPAAPLASPGQAAPEGHEGTTTETAAPPSFEEAAAARGGFSRFGGLLRRRPATPPEPEAIPAAVVSTVEPAESGSGPAPDVAATDAVIDALTGAPVAGNDKRLGLDDPLVTSVQTPAQERAAAAEAAVPEEPIAPGTVPEAVTEPDEAKRDGDDRQATDAAMDSLRKRRMERLRSESS